jgi:F-type H+-transporting ATPase subunit b
MNELLNDSNFWVLISFIVFVCVAIKYGKAAALKLLDDKIDAIKLELSHAENLRVQAQELLAEYQRKHKDAMGEAESIIADAKKHAETLRLKAEEEMDKTSKRREKQLNEKLARIEQNARQDIESYTAQIAINAARQIMTETMDAKTDKAIIDNTLSAISKSLH